MKIDHAERETTGVVGKAERLLCKFTEILQLPQDK